MRWVTFSSDGGDDEAVGVLDGDRVALVSRRQSLLDMLRGSPEAWAQAGRKALADGPFIPLSDVSLRAPIPVPPSMRDFMGFEQHVAASAKERGGEVAKEWYQVPAFWFMSPTSVVGPNDNVPIAPGSSAFDFEVELAVVIGKAGRDIAVEDAESYIAGFMIMNDWTARDIVAQDFKVGLGPSKGKDTATTLGPALVTPDELQAYRGDAGWDIEMVVSVNGREYGRDRSSKMYWSLAEMIAYASRGALLVPGDVLASGTYGWGCIKEMRFARGADQYPWLKPGDEVAIELSGLGRICNRIVAGTAPKPFRRAKTAA